MINTLASYNDVLYICDDSQMNSLTGLPIVKNDLKTFSDPYGSQWIKIRCCYSLLY